MLMIINALLIVACAHAAGDATFRPWALNDSKAFVFPRIAEKRNRGRRERLAAALRKTIARVFILFEIYLLARVADSAPIKFLDG
jgi:hypothetical protein